MQQLFKQHVYQKGCEKSMKLLNMLKKISKVVQPLHMTVKLQIKILVSFFQMVQKKLYVKRSSFEFGHSYGQNINL